MKFSGLFALIAALAASSTTLAIPAVEFERAELADLPGLNPTQEAHARAIIGANNQGNYGRQGCLAAITTGLTESKLRILANPKVPASLKYKHDATGTDHDSIGIFQQRASIYKNIACDMDAACSAGQFFKEMKAISGWQTMDVPTLCQKVQRSAFPARYREYLASATAICQAAGF
ncbi:hypothetical protein HIM_03470 [Hirsutella minnesotensis 3608]|uniref:Uncharacterized protein n=1 Tax=Hirsutella minnesotensis 3608 TaxID=1043627 RepID=A0A0F8A6I7_9HYPO|nr:hypothetical protein HIM_03470 [Hirsutella minnesotensis 3608]